MFTTNGLEGTVEGYCVNRLVGLIEIMSCPISDNHNPWLFIPVCDHVLVENIVVPLVEAGWMDVPFCASGNNPQTVPTFGS